MKEKHNCFCCTVAVCRFSWHTLLPTFAEEREFRVTIQISSFAGQNQKPSYTLTKHICIRIVPRFSFIKYVVHVWKYIKPLCAFKNALWFWNQNNLRTVFHWCGLLCDKRFRRNPWELLTEWLMLIIWI